MGAKLRKNKSKTKELILFFAEHSGTDPVVFCHGRFTV